MVWKYIDKQAFTIAALQDFNAMKDIISITPEETKETYTLIEDKETDDPVLKRYDVALKYMKWFLPAWNRLKEQDRNILKEFYMSGDLKSGATVRLQHKLNYSDRQIDRLRASALKELILRLLGET
jgi:hypothetical protein